MKAHETAEKKSIVEITFCTEPCAFILNSVNTAVLKLDGLDALLMQVIIMSLGKAWGLLGCMVRIV